MRAASPALLSGDYHTVAIRDLASAGWASFVGTFRFDGLSEMTLVEGHENEDGVGSSVTPGTARSYAVSATGTLTVGDYQGAVSPDGRVAFMVGPITGGGGSPELWFMLR